MANRRDVIRAGLAAVGATALGHPVPALATPTRYGIVGRVAPALRVEYWIDANGEPTRFDLASLRDKWVLLECFQSWCPGCHAYGLPALKKMSAALAGNPGIAFAAIQTVFEGHFINTAERLREIQLRYDLRLPVGHDPGDEGGRAYTMIDYRTGGTPWAILIEPGGTVVYNEFDIDPDKAIDFLRRQTA